MSLPAATAKERGAATAADSRTPDDAAMSRRRIRMQPSATAMAWVGADRPHEALAVLEVALEPGDALVEVELATICEADLGVVDGTLRAPAPAVLGREAVGRIVEVGEGADGADGSPLRIGDRVVWSASTACSGCDRCRRGLTQHCRRRRRYGRERVTAGWELSGAFATHVHLKAGTVAVRVSEAVPAMSLAPLPGPFATAVAAVNAAADTVDLDDALVLVIGAGLTGLAVTALASERGAQVIVFEPAPARRALALRFGAQRAIEPTRAARRRAAEGSGGEVDAVFETTTMHTAQADALGQTAEGGVTVLVGDAAAGEPVMLDTAQLVRTDGVLRGIDGYAPHHLAEAVAFVQRHWRRLPFAELVGETVPLARLDEGIEIAATGRHLRVAVAPRA